nr:CU044_5270 family protein [Streptomyces sp. SID8379]
MPPGRHRALREHLLREIDSARETPVRTSWRRPVLLAPVAAAALAVAVVVGVAVTRDASSGPAEPRPGVFSTHTSAVNPTMVLDRAALAAEGRKDVPTKDSQFLYLEQEGYHWKTDPGKKLPEGCFTTGEARRPDGVQELWQSVDGRHVGLRREHRADGTLVDHPIAVQSPGQDLPTSYRQAERELPTDVNAMYRWLVKGDDHVAAFGKARLLLDSLVLPPRTSATLFRALARIPGLVVVEDARDLLGRTGVAVALDTTDEQGTLTGERSELIFRTDNSLYLGSSTVELAAPKDRCDVLDPGDLIMGTVVLGQAVVARTGQNR